MFQEYLSNKNHPVILNEVKNLLHLIGDHVYQRFFRI